MAAAAFTTLQHELDRCLADTIALARTARTQTAAEWRALVEAMHASTGRTLPFAGDAANPAEVRGVLLAICTLYGRRLAAVETAVDHDELVDAIWTFRHRRLAGLVETELAAYIQHVAPRPTIAAAFGKVVGPIVTQEVPVHVQLHRCKRCGAPRRAEQLYGDCLYCGHPLFKEID